MKVLGLLFNVAFGLLGAVWTIFEFLVVNAKPESQSSSVWLNNFLAGSEPFWYDDDDVFVANPED